MFRRRTDKIYATLQQVQRRITQGTEPGEGQVAGDSIYTATGSQDQRSWSQNHGGTSAGYMVTPDGRRVSVEPQGASHATHITSSSDLAGRQAEQPRFPIQPPSRGVPPPRPLAPPPQPRQQMPQLRMSPPPPAPPPQQDEQQDEQQYEQQQYEQQQYEQQPYQQQPYQQQQAPAAGRHGLTVTGDEDHSPAAANPALNLAAKEGRPRRLELSIELATVLALVWFGTLGVAFFVGRGEFTGGGFDQVGTHDVGTQVAVEGPRPTPGVAPQVPQQVGSAPLASNGSEILLLQSVGSYSRDAEDRFQALADKFNAAATEAKLDAIFGVRRPRSGGLQFVYGKIGSNFGIRRDDQRGKDIHSALKDKFPNLRWVDIGD